MNNADVFKRMFGIYAEEFWAFPKDKMLDWLQYENVADTNVGDMVYRQTAIDADWLVQKIEGWQDQLAETYGQNDEYVLCLSEVLMKIDDAPTIAVQQPKKGRWLKPREWPKKTYRRLCSNCQDVAYYCGNGNYRYCPNCGAKMKGEQDEQV